MLNAFASTGAPHAFRPGRLAAFHPHRRIAEPDPGRTPGVSLAGRRQRTDQGAGGAARYTSAVPRQSRCRVDPGGAQAADACPPDHAPGRLPESRVHPVRHRPCRAYSHLRQHHCGHRVFARSAGRLLGQAPWRDGRPAGASVAGYRARCARWQQRHGYHRRSRGGERLAGDAFQHRPPGADRPGGS